MKVTDKQIERFVKTIINELKKVQLISFKEKEDKVVSRAMELVKVDFKREQELDGEVHRMMDDLEVQNPNGFQRYKMFPLLKKRLAKEKGIVL